MARYVVAFEAWVREEKLGMIASHYAGFAKGQTGAWAEIGTAVPDLSGEYFMVTGSGKYFRNVQLDPATNVCIIEVNETGENYRIVRGLAEGGRPI